MIQNTAGYETIHCSRCSLSPKGAVNFMQQTYSSPVRPLRGGAPFRSSRSPTQLRPLARWSPWPTEPSGIQAGEIHALVGENGAGKSTLVKIVAGVHRRDSGVVRWHGEDVDFARRAESKAAGIAVIYQEPTLSRTKRSPRTSSWAASPSAASGSIGQAIHTPGHRASCSSASGSRSTRPRRPRPVHRRPADHRDRQGHFAGRQSPGDGRAHGSAQRRRG